MQKLTPHRSAGKTTGRRTKALVLLSTGLLALAGAQQASARTVTLNGDIGCGLFRTQLERIEIMRIVMETSMLRAQGDKTEMTKFANEKAAKDMVEISNTECRPVTGKFSVLERRTAPGAEAVRIQPTKHESLWVLGPFE